MELPLRLLEKMVRSSGNFGRIRSERTEIPSCFIIGVIIKQYLEN
jgi:hypothetical protein